MHIELQRDALNKICRLFNPLVLRIFENFSGSMGKKMTGNVNQIKELNLRIKFKIEKCTNLKVKMRYDFLPNFL